jgi:glutamate 5-kinase
MWVAPDFWVDRTDDQQRTQYQNAQNTFNELLNMGIIPIVNENDTISVAVRRLSFISLFPERPLILPGNQIR